MLETVSWRPSTSVPRSSASLTTSTATWSSASPGGMARLSAAPASAIANELRRLDGISAKATHAAQRWAGRPKGELSPQLSKIEALLADSHRKWEYAHAVARRMFRVTRLEWCNPEQLCKVIAALQIDANRRIRRESSQE